MLLCKFNTYIRFVQVGFLFLGNIIEKVPESSNAVIPELFRTCGTGIWNRSVFPLCI